jgi:hypothetical protein
VVKFKSLPILAGAAGLLATSMALPTAGHATLYQQNSDHCTPACGINTGNTVTVTGTGTLDITVQLATGWNFVDTGGHQAFDFSLNGISQVTGTILAGTSDAANWTFQSASPAHPAVGTSTTVTGQASIMDDGLTIPSQAYALDHLTSGNNADGNFLEFTISAAGLTTGSFNLLQPGTSTFAADVLSANGSTGVIDFSLVPAPVIGHGLLVLLAVGGVLSGSKLLERHKKHQLQAA